MQQQLTTKAMQLSRCTRVFSYNRVFTDFFVPALDFQSLEKSPRSSFHARFVTGRKRLSPLLIALKPSELNSSTSLDVNRFILSITRASPVQILLDFAPRQKAIGEISGHLI